MADIQSVALGPQNGKTEKTDPRDCTMDSTPNTSVTDIAFDDVEAHIRYKEFKTRQVRILCWIYLYVIPSILTISHIGVWWCHVGMVNTETHFLGLGSIIEC